MSTAINYADDAAIQAVGDTIGAPPADDMPDLQKQILAAICVVLGAGSGGGSTGITITPNRGNLIDRSGTIATGNLAQEVAAVNATRQYFLFQNVSDTDMYINPLGNATVGAGSILCPADGGGLIMENNFISTQRWTVICTANGKAYTCLEA